MPSRSRSPPSLVKSRPRIRGPTWLTRFSAAHPERRVPSLLSLGPGKELVERSTTYAVKMVVRSVNQRTALISSIVNGVILGE
ncbi:hypothetical protein VTI28DRAFT_438 [Corynascus sepedonium]